MARRPMAVPDRGVSGRVLDMIVRGSKGTVKVSGQAFQSIFGLPQTGTVDFATWYKISHIYVGVTRIAELK